MSRLSICRVEDFQTEAFQLFVPLDVVACLLIVRTAVKNKICLSDTEN